MYVFAEWERGGRSHFQRWGPELIVTNVINFHLTGFLTNESLRKSTGGRNYTPYIMESWWLAALSLGFSPSLTNLVSSAKLPK